jgi:hypothetical protein
MYADNPNSISSIVGSWECQYVLETTMYKQKYVFYNDNKLEDYLDNGTDTYTKAGSGYYSIDNEKSRITITLTEFNGEPTDLSYTMTFAIGYKKMVLGEVMVGGNTETLVGNWNNYISYKGNFIQDTTYELNADGTIKATITTTKETEEPTIEIANAKWKKVSNKEITIFNSDNEEVLLNHTYSYQIVGKGLVSMYVGIDAFIYTKTED